MRYGSTQHSLTTHYNMRPLGNQARHGNILFIILIAIGLFALLGSVVMDGDSTTNNISKDKAKIYAQDILNYANSMEQAVQRMMSKGVSENDLCFDYDEYPGGNADYEHAGCAEEENRVFHPSGGGMRHQTPDTKYLDTAQSAYFGYGEYIPSGVTDIIDLPRGTSSGGENELILFLAGVKESICIAYNNAVNLGEHNATPPLEYQTSLMTNSTAYFTGTFTATSQIGGNNIPSNTYWHGITRGCLQPSVGNYSSTGYIIFYALHVR